MNMSGSRHRSIITMLTLGFVWLLANGAPASADNSDGVRPPLPRTFQNVRLGMSVGELARQYPRHAGLRRDRHDHRTVVLPSADRHIRHLEGRFFQGTLYELAILYRPDRLPRGSASLLQRLKAQYGPPLIDGQEDSDYERWIFSEKKTVWSDDQTRIVFIERRKLGDVTPSELVVQMTDLATERRRDEYLQEQKRLRELSIPVPTVDGRSLPGRTARSVLRDDRRDSYRAVTG
jgi:hypothetical protein